MGRFLERPSRQTWTTAGKMNQLYTLFVLGAMFALGGYACVSNPRCPELSGRWTNREGQDFVFQPDGRAMWLVKFGSSYDTSRFKYETNCNKAPVQLDMHSFQSGPYIGKVVFGIVEWSSDTSFRLRYEPGSDGNERPKAFDNEQTLQFYSVQ